MASRKSSKRNVLSVSNDNNILESATKQKPHKRSRKSIETPANKVPHNIFTRLVSEAGFTFNIQGNKLSVDSVSFWQKLNKLVECHDDEVSETVDAFSAALEESLENEPFFISCLMATELSVSLDELGLTSSQMPTSIQDSLLKMMLHSDHLQNVVASALIKKLPLYSENENVKVDPAFGISSTSGADIVNVPRLILNQLRWLDLVKHSAVVATQLLEMASVMQSEVACDIISFIPDLLADDEDHASVALNLCDLLSNGPENITSSVFDALSNLALDEDVEKKVHDLAVSYLSTASVEDIPVITKYLLKSCTNSNFAKQIIMLLRPHLDFSVLLSNISEENQQSLKSSTTLLCDILYSSMQIHSYIATAWIDVLEKTRSANINVGDIIALFLLCDVNSPQNRKNAVHLFQSKLKRGLLPQEQIQKTVEKCCHLISPRFMQIRHLTQGLLWHSHPSLKKAAAFLYKLYLLNLDSFCKQETIGVLVEHISAMTSGKNSETNVSLDVLCEIARQKPSVLIPYANFLRDALDRMDLMTLSQVRKSYQILSLLAFSGATDAFTLGMRDEMHMGLQKQLTNISDRFRHIGIIGSVTVLVSMSPTFEEKEACLKKEVNSLLETLNYVLRNYIKGWSLFFDEIFIASTNKNSVSKFLAKKINDIAQSKLQEKFLTDFNGIDGASCINDVECCYRFGLLSAEEQKETELGIQLTSLILNSQHRYIPSLLCSIFRAISSLEKISSGSLGEIDALLCCPILLHDVMYENKERFKDLPADKSMCILDSMFAVLNWFRELVSVFCVESDVEMQLNVLVRLKQICDLQRTIEKMLPLAPDSYTPNAVNSNEMDSAISKNLPFKSNTKSQSSSKLSSPNAKKSQNVTISSSAGPSNLTKAKKEKKSSSIAVPVSLLSSAYRPCLRELSKEVFVLLQHPLQCTKKNHKELEENSSPEEKFLRPRHLLFLLNDLNEKLRHRLSVSKLPPGFSHLANSGVGFERIDQIPARKVAELAVQLVPHLCRHLDEIYSYYQNRLSKQSTSHDDSDDSMFSQDSGLAVFEDEHLKSGYSTLIDILYYIISWHGLDDESNKSLLESLLKHLSGRLKTSGTQTLDFTVMLSNSFRYIHAFSATVPTSAAAHSLLKLLIVIRDFADGHKSQETWMAKKISDTALVFLKREWNDSASADVSTQKLNSIMSGLFSIHLKYSEDVLESIEQFLKNSLCYLLSESRPEDMEVDDPSDVSYPCLTKANFYLFYSSMMEALGGQAADVAPPGKGPGGDVDNIDLLLNWSEIVKVLDMLVRVLKTFSSRVMLKPALKHARSTVESFIKTGIPVCEVTFREHQDDVINLLKKVQISTRQLQHVVCHSKVSKDSSLTNHVPALKRCLETFVFRVKAMLVLHNCREAFWLGNLKNRTLQGDELLSQAPASPSTSDDDDVTSSAAADTTERSYSESY